jgi:transposase
VNDRRVLNGIFYVLRTGSPWRDLPERYGPYTTVYNRFNRWAGAGVWVQIFETLAAKSPHSMAFIDSSIIRAHQHAAGGKRGPGSRHRSLSWRTKHQNQCLGR